MSGRRTRVYWLVGLTLATVFGFALLAPLVLGIPTPPPCFGLPAEARVREVVESHPETMAKVQAAGPYARVYVEPARDPGCRDKAYILIHYDTIWTQVRIWRVLGPSFHGIPYRMQNV